jgi:HD-GYP domain-containing protein (c-di-GMP phosphodiesterase class II)
MGISDAVMLKTPTSMAPRELEEYQKHPIRGQVAVDSIEDLRNAGTLIRHHHEWFNGKGFPDKLKEDKIPIGSRIIALADGFDRLRHGIFDIHSTQSVLSRLRTQLGTQFDPELFPHLAEIVKDEASIYSDTASSQEIGASTIVEIAASPTDLLPGMIASRDIRSGTGVLLLSKGTILDEGKISVLKRNLEIDPVKEAISVYMKRKK